MRIILAPDSYKGSLSAAWAAHLLEDAARRVFGDEAETACVPIADGGEGTLDAVLTARAGEKRFCRVCGPCGEPVEAAYAFLDARTALIEMAQAAGLPLMNGRPDPMIATTRGVGELILRAMDEGAEQILIGLGGSATNDGGTGMLRALGVRFLDADGRETQEGARGLQNMAKMELSGLDSRLNKTKFVVLSDVSNPLLGENGATMVYGPQKGADGHALKAMERGMKNYAETAFQALGRDIAGFPGAGAAGGMGAALCGVLNGTVRSGIEQVLELAGFDQLLAQADLCVSGEGNIDGQSVRFGKAISGIAKKCAAARVPLAVVAGGMSEDAEALFRVAESSIMTVVNAPMTLEDAMKRAETLFSSAAERMFRLIRMGMLLRK